MNKSKRCRRCKQPFSEAMLYWDNRLSENPNHLYCVPCLTQSLIERVMICYGCKSCLVGSEKRDGEYILCGKCIVAQGGLGCIALSLSRAKVAGLDHTLTTEQWEMAIQYFEGMCAYCQIRPYSVLEHFIPITLGGGTTQGNCVPACRNCNRKKLNYHPDTIKHKFLPGTIERVQAYLNQFL